MVSSRTLHQLVQGHMDFIRRAETAEQYFANNNQIRKIGAAWPYPDGRSENPLRLADNRISHNWHNLLVNQKVGYLLTYAPSFDLGQEQANQKVQKALGDGFPRVCKELAVDASNTGVGWLHYWVDEGFQYARVDPKQVIPIYSADLRQKLVGVVRSYTLQEADGEYQYCEYWDDTQATRYRQNANGNYAFAAFVGGESHQFTHGMGRVPFVPFFNNGSRQGDLPMVKDLIDAYDKVVSGFANDIDDVQEVIFVLHNYGGQDKEEFMQDLKLSKLIKVEGDGDADTIRAEIPYEARSSFLDRVRRQIFTSGMGVDSDPEQFGNTSGVALKFLYSLLELKAGLMETEFRQGFAQLVRAICHFYDLAEPAQLIQTWTRNAIQNDLETAQIAQQSVGVISQETIVKNHPWVEDVTAEIAAITQEQSREQTQYPLKGAQDEE